MIPTRQRCWTSVLRALAGLLLAFGCASDASAVLRLDVFVTGLSLPVAFIQDPVYPTVQYVVEQGGRIRVVISGVLQSTPFLDLTPYISSGGERGLLGLAFAPDYAASGRFFVNFTDPDGNTVIARFHRSALNPLVADLASRFDLMWPGGLRYIVQPYANHNGGTIVFGPDGYLYIGMGDGGDANDPGNRAQSLTTLLGKMLRIDINVADSDTVGYVNPISNPFVSQIGGALPPIWSYGLRNPWKFSFDNATGAMIIADVGQNAWEEIDYEPAGFGGRNYGWRYREGAHDNLAYAQPVPPVIGTNPIYEYPHSNGDAAITGGYLYRGTALGPSYYGRYFFADYVSGRVWSLPYDFSASGLIDHTRELGGLGSISSFGVDAHGELYIVGYSAGTVLRIMPPYATVTASSGSPVLSGTSITWTVTSPSGTAPLLYKFYRLKLGVGWELARDYAPSNTYTWTPGPGDVGTYYVQAWVRSSLSSAPYETVGNAPSFQVVVASPIVLTVAADRSFPSPAYIPVTLTAFATGGGPPIQYQFWRLKAGGAWTIVQSYSTSNTYTWIPTPTDAGTYSFLVWARSSGSVSAYDTYTGFNNAVITGPAPVQLTGFGSSVAFPVTVGTPVTFGASAFGGTPPVQFRYTLFDSNTGGWSVLQEYSQDSSVNWLPVRPGDYAVQVWVRSSTSPNLYDDWRGTGYFTVVPSAVPVVTSLSPTPPTPGHVGVPMTWSATVVGGTGPYQYKFLRLRSGVGWVVAQDYSSSPTYTWTPQAGDEGVYLFQVWVRNAGSTAPYDGWLGSGYFYVVP